MIDIGQVIVDGGFGWWCESNSAVSFSAAVEAAIDADYTAMKENATRYLEENYTVAKAYKTIMIETEQKEPAKV